ncbi:MAG: NUDIX hydrolase [Betaproteobacteria bacterium]|nr:NUDIX hydrolase [Betaproteobacteria bacterium]
MSHRWKPSVTVAAVIERNGRFLLVEEETADGLQFNQPAGHLEANESLLQAVVRETMEETAHPFTPEYLVGIYQWPRPQGDAAYLRFAFSGWVGESDPARTLDSGIVRTVWMTLEELHATHARHRSPLVLQCAEDWLSGRHYGLELLRHYGNGSLP